jgi:hypothetical protein
MTSYKKARGLVVSYAYNTYGLYDTITAADMVDVRLCQLAEEYNLTDKEIYRLNNYLNKITNDLLNSEKKHRRGCEQWPDAYNGVLPIR